MTISQPIKVWCSSVRDPQMIERLATEHALVSCSPAPRVGDLVVARCLSDRGAYTHIENQYGREVRLYAGDHIVAVLGHRSSGTNLCARLPEGPLSAGTELQLAAVGGLVGSVTCTPRYYGAEALPVSVIGFLQGPDGVFTNLRQVQRLPGVPTAAQSIDRRCRVLFVAGSAAETGKTTVLCEAIRVIREDNPGHRIAAVKTCGTGRLRDLMRYRDAGAHVTYDFVAHGWPSTYGLSESTYRTLFAELVEVAVATADVALFELGGDLLEAGAPWALDVAAHRRASVLLCVNDAMGALNALDTLEAQGLPVLAVTSLRQNPVALGARLGRANVIEASDREALRSVLRSSDAASRRQNSGVPTR